MRLTLDDALNLKTDLMKDEGIKNVTIAWDEESCSGEMTVVADDATLSYALTY